ALSRVRGVLAVHRHAAEPLRRLRRGGQDRQAGAGRAQDDPRGRDRARPRAGRDLRGEAGRGARRALDDAPEGVGRVMAKVFEAIDDKLADWLLAQPVFFVATAPLAAGGRVNVSPKGMAGTFAVLGPRRVGYLDYFGSGIETVAHLRENGRIVIMCCAFTGRPQVVRLHGLGRVVFPDASEFGELR